MIGEWPIWVEGRLRGGVLHRLHIALPAMKDAFCRPLNGHGVASGHDALPFFHSYFFLAGSKTGAEGSPGQASAFVAGRISGRSLAERFDAAPALRNLPAEKMGSRLPVSLGLLALRR